MHSRLLFIAACLLLWNVGFLPVEAGADCKDLLPSRLRIGDQGVVLPGPANNVRAEPSTEAARLGKIPPTGVFDVLDGPVCAEGYVWWAVDYDGLQGWTTEGLIDDGYYLTYYADGKPKWYGEIRDPVLILDEFPVDEGGRVTVYGVSMVLEGAPIPSTTAEATLYDSVNPYNTEFPFWYVLPAHVQLVAPFFDPASQTELGHITINVYPASLYSTYYPGSMDALRTGLENRPPEGLILADLVMRNAVMVMNARRAHLDMPWGIAYRDLRHHVQTMDPPGTGYEYTLVGLTADGRYYIEASTFITAAIPWEVLEPKPAPVDPNDPDAESKAYMDAIFQVYQDSVDFLNRAAADVFTPRLERIDAVMATLEIAPDTLADYWATPPELIDFPITPKDESG